MDGFIVVVTVGTVDRYNILLLCRINVPAYTRITLVYMINNLHLSILIAFSAQLYIVLHIIELL